MNDRTRPALVTLLSAVFCFSLTCQAQDVYNLKYPDDPASHQQPGVPKGEVLEFRLNDSKTYPGTSRTYWVYIPAQYKPGNPACLYVCMDGVQFNAPVVFDNLISKGEMPVTIGVFVGSGTVMKNDKDALRFNRSNEFDFTGDKFSRFLLNELLPDAESKSAADGRAIHFSKDAKDRAIAGTSSGAICAFTVAWQRPDAFSRVFSSIGTYVGMRGGDQYPVLIRKTDPKPIRVFLVDNLHDSWNPLFGNWFMENVDMEAAFSFAGYEATHSWGEGGHDNIRADAVFPDAMRWLWKGWPAAVKSGPSANSMLKDILADNESWKAVDTKFALSANLETGSKGLVFCTDSAGTIYKVNSNDEVLPFVKTGINISGLSADQDGALSLTGSSQKGVAVYNSEGKKKMIHTGITASGIIATKRGGKYLVAPGVHEGDAASLWLADNTGQAKLLDADQYLGSGMAISPDGGLLYVSEKYSNWLFSYVIQADGTLKYKQRFYWLHNVDNYSHTEIHSIAVDDGGNLYVATPMGIQVCDQNGRVRAILTLPGGAVTAVCFGGEKLDTLYAVCGGKLFKRKLKIHGAPAWAAPIAFSSQGAG